MAETQYIALRDLRVNIDYILYVLIPIKKPDCDSSASQVFTNKDSINFTAQIKQEHFNALTIIWAITKLSLKNE